MAAFAGYPFTDFAQVAGWSFAGQLGPAAAVVVIFTMLNADIAFRGIDGSTLTAIAIDASQITSLVAFSIFAIVFRITHPNHHDENSVTTIPTGRHNFIDVIVGVWAVVGAAWFIVNSVRSGKPALVATRPVTP